MSYLKILEFTVRKKQLEILTLQKGFMKSIKFSYLSIQFQDYQSSQIHINWRVREQLNLRKDNLKFYDFILI